MAHAEHPNPVTLTPERVQDAFEPYLDRAAGETCRFIWHPLDPEIVGYVVRPGFQDVDALQRVLWVRDRLRAALGSDSEQILLILPTTPEEYASYLEPDF